MERPQISISRRFLIILVACLAAGGLVSGIVFNVDKQQGAYWLPWVVLGLSAWGLWLMAGKKFSGGDVSGVVHSAAPREFEAHQPPVPGRLGTLLFIALSVVGALAVSPPAWLRELFASFQ